MTIMPGVHIGDGAVIGANSTVSKNVPPYTIAAGNPVREIRKRFSPKEIAILQQINWWDWNIQKILDHLEIILGNDVHKLQAIQK